MSSTVWYGRHHEGQDDQREQRRAPTRRSTRRGGRRHGSCRALMRGPKSPAGRIEEHDRRHQVEHGQLDLREERDAGLAHEAHDERADQRALEAAEPADDHDDEREDQRVHAHAEHRALLGHDDGAAEARHEAAEREGLHVDAVDVDAEGRGHAHVLGGGAQHDAELGAVDEGPEPGGRDAADRR